MESLVGAVEGRVCAITLLYHAPDVQRPPRSRPLALTAALALAVAALGGCEDPYAYGRAPVIESVRPEPAPPGAPVTLVGRGFGLRGDRDRVWLGDVELEVESWSEAAVSVRLPEAPPGLTTLVVRAGARVSAPYPFEVLDPAAGADRGAPSEDRGIR